MGRRDVQRLEVVPVRLRLRTLGHGEPHAHEDVFEVGAGLARRVQVPARRRRAHLIGDDLGQVEAVGPEGLGPLGRRQLGPPGRQKGFELFLRLTEPATGHFAGLGVETTEGAVGAGQRRALAQELDLDLGQRLARRRALDRRARRRR